MLNTSLLKIFTQPIAGVTLLIAVTIGFPVANPAQAQTPSSSVGTLSTTYTLGGGDRIRVNVFEVPEYTGEYAIPPGGAINLPLIGSVPIQGLTTEQAADEIAKRYSRYLRRPLISVNLLSPRPINVFVAGEVTTPGAYTLSLSGGAGDNPGVQYPTVLSAITTAKGATLSADITRVVVRRKLRNGQQQEVTLNLKEFIKTGNIPQDITLRDGDSIFVPTATSFNLAEARNLAATTFAADTTTPRTVGIIGEVHRPGSYLVTQGSTTVAGETNVTGLPTVTRAIQLAGGITSQADIRNVVLRRPTRTGAEQSININLWQLLQSGDVNQDILVQDGDTIVIPTVTEVNRAEATQLATTTLSPPEIRVGVVGEVKAPGQVQLPPNTPLNQAILAAGSFNDARARKKTVQLVRLNPDGSVTKRGIKVDLSAGINENTNPILRDNDIVIVGRSGIAQATDGLNTVAGPLGTFLGILRFFGIGF
ncbi:MAG: SLBB domain-containing protein [Nostocaceae cyanobacterium]|nr:SLBB domain-containing protein [Nostocaceae cyanobacterium]